MEQLSLKIASAVVEGSIAAARRFQLPPLTVVVIDASGHLKAAAREDGASMFRFDVAVGKAWAAVAMGKSSRDLALAAASNPNFFMALAATAGGKFLPQPGAVLIHGRSGKIIGAAGASGATGDEDEAACLAGVLSVQGELAAKAAQPS